ncbi:MAG: hypothetical protein ACTSSH_12470 [Candidatus Heimdallarchaeota archaeon]
MAIIEAGVMFGGIPIVKKYFYDEKTTDSLLTSGLLEAIQAFAVEIFNDDTETFKMKKYSIFLLKTKLKSEQVVTLYCICDSEDRPGTIKDVMKLLAGKFIDHFNNVDVSSLAHYAPFESVMTKDFGDLIYRPEDRLRKVFLSKNG